MGASVEERRQCPICSRLFIARRANQRCCSPACQLEWRRLEGRRWKMEMKERLRAEGLPPRFCLACGKSFVPHRAKQLYCCKGCQAKLQRKRCNLYSSSLYISEVDWLNCQLEKALLKLREVERAIKHGDLDAQA